MREFESGATRDNDTGKLDYEGFLSPLVLKRYAEYLNKHRVQADGKIRDSDNWQRGIPVQTYMKSLWRHFMDMWTHHRGLKCEADQQDAICAVLFNAMGYLHEVLREQTCGDCARYLTECYRFSINAEEPRDARCFQAKESQ